MTPVNDLLALLKAQAGDRYVFGAEARHSDPDPDTFDCSELIEWACARLGVTPRMPDGSWYQARHVRNHNTGTTVARALATPGALLFRFSSDPYSGDRPRSAHVAVSLGNSQTVEARSTSLGVGVFGGASGRTWTHAGLIPGVDYGGDCPPALTEPPTWPGRYLKLTTIRFMRGEDIKTVQRRLTHHGVYEGDTDGVFGPLTRGAVRAFQQSRRLTVDGVVGPVTWKHLWT